MGKGVNLRRSEERRESGWVRWGVGNPPGVWGDIRIEAMAMMEDGNASPDE